MKVTHYRLSDHGTGVSFRAAVVADLHDRPCPKLLPILEAERPDLILVPGDLCERLDEARLQDPKLDPPLRPGLDLLPSLTAIAPTFYSLGNHEIGGCHGAIYRAKLAGKELPRPSIARQWLEKITASGATLVNQAFVEWQGLVIGGLGSGLLNPDWIPDLAFLDDFAAAPGYKLLLSHHPEYFDRYLRPYPIDLIVSGHAHGGQWRIFGRGVYAPDQHLFPKYTSGVHEDRLVISRGVVNSVPIVPRFFNPCEVVMLEVGADA